MKCCLVRGCNREQSSVYRKTIPGYLKGGIYSNSKYCTMHAQRKSKYGNAGSIEPKRENGKSRPNSNGYLRGTLNGKRDYMHRIIYEQALGTIQKGCHIHHKNGDKTNNRLDNLMMIPGRLHIREHQLGNSWARK